MTLLEYKTLLLKNMYPEAWTNISCGGGGGPSYRNDFSVWTDGNGKFLNLDIKSHYGLLSLKENISVQIAYGLEDNPDFKEAWANGNPDPKASSCFVDFFYNNQLVYRDISVIVDGGRCYLPLPQLDYDSDYKVKSIKVERERYDFFSLLNGHANSMYDRYVKSSGFLITEESWMI